MNAGSLGATAGGLLAAVVAAEYGLRAWFGRGRYFVFAPRMRELLEPDPETHPQLERRIHFEINRDGERGAPFTPGPGQRRILVLGGSAAECRLLDDATSWPGELEHELNRPEHLAQLGARHVHIGTAAKSGMDSATLGLVLSRILPNYPQLDLIIIFSGASDMVRWLELGAPPDRPVESIGVDAAFDWHPEKRYSWRPRTMALAEAFRRIRTLRVRYRPKAARWMGRARAMRMNAQRIIDVVPEPEVVLRTYSKNLETVLRLARQGAPHVLMVRQPWFEKPSFSDQELPQFWNGGTGSSYARDITEFYSHRVMFELMHQTDATSVAVAERLGVTHVDLNAVLPMSSDTFIDHFHFTPAGTRSVARGVLPHVLRLLGASAPRPGADGGRGSPR